MTIEQEPAAQTDLSYRFSEQIDQKTGIPVGLVPLEVVRRKGLLENIPFSSTYHDIGGGTGASARHILSMIGADTKSGMSVVISEPFNCVGSEAREDISNQVESLTIYRNEAVSAAGIVDADVASLINMVHLIPKEDRKVMWKRLFESSRLAIIITTFIQNWIPDEYREQVGGFMETWMMRIARDAKGFLSDEDFAEFRRRKKENKLPLLDSDELVGELTSAGFEVEHQSIETMPCTVESYDLIRYDEEWLSFITPGIKPELASIIQGGALRKVVEAKGLDAKTPMPRNTLVVVARKPMNKKGD